MKNLDSGTKRRFFCALLLLFTLQLYTTFCEAGVINHYAYPVDTVQNGGQNSFDTPSIAVQYEFKLSLGFLGTIRITHNDVLAAGGATSMGWYGYIAALCTNGVNSQICANECTYGVNCTDQTVFSSIKSTACLNESPPPSQTAQCDQSLTTGTLYSCNPPPATAALNPASNTVGICAYVAKSPNWRAVFGLSSVNTDLNSARANAANLQCNFPGYNLIDCFPAPFPPPPPPFGAPPYGSSTDISLYRICSQDELAVNDQTIFTPIHLLSSYVNQSENGCVMPSSTPYSTFSNTCVRITYENPQANPTNPPPPINADFNANGDEQLYQFSVIASDQSQTTYYARNAIIYNDLSSQGIQISSSPSLYGYNGPVTNTNVSAYLDLCATAFSDGSTSLGSGTLQDVGGARTFQVFFPPIISNPNASSTTLAFFGTQVCVNECPTSDCSANLINRGCITRPVLSAPTISFCSGNPSPPNIPPCITASFPNDFPPPPNPPSSNPPYTSPLSIKLSPGDSGVGSLELGAVLTDECYLNQYYGSVANKLSQSNSVCYPKNIPDTQCCDVTITPNCVTPASAFTSPDPVQYLCFSSNPNSTPPITATGAPKLCLTGYTTSQSRPSPIWCGSSAIQTTSRTCNNVCTHYTVDPTILPPAVPVPISTDYIAQRADPGPFPGNLYPSSGSLIPSPPGSPPDYTTDSTTFCSGGPETLPNSANPNPTQSSIYRVKNPVEEDLCVDVYPMTFKPNPEQQSLLNPEQQTLFNDITTLCYDTGTSTNKYTNFTACMRMFYLCLNNLSSTVAQVSTAANPINFNVSSSTAAQTAGSDLTNAACYKIISLYSENINLPPGQVCSTLPQNQSAVCTYCQNSNQINSSNAPYLIPNSSCNTNLNLCSGTSPPATVTFQSGPTNVACSDVLKVWQNQPYSVVPSSTPPPDSTSTPPPASGSGSGGPGEHV